MMLVLSFNVTDVYDFLLFPETDGLAGQVDHQK
jgi:hypothetical protein